jgi:hypothetical protein
MPVVHATIRIAQDGTISGRAPREVPPGEYRAPITVPGTPARRQPLDLPLHDSGPWPADFRIRREEIYGDDGR